MGQLLELNGKRNLFVFFGRLFLSYSTISMRKMKEFSTNILSFSYNFFPATCWPIQSCICNFINELNYRLECKHALHEMLKRSMSLFVPYAHMNSCLISLQKGIQLEACVICLQLNTTHYALLNPFAVINNTYFSICALFA